jgi:transposase-like protein
MNERERFVKRYEETGAMSALCREFGISRKTGYKWAGREQEASPRLTLSASVRGP